MSDARQQVVNFTTLSSQFRIISPSPAWPAVQDALARLRSPRTPGTTYELYESDVQSVQAFARLLEDRAAVVAQALWCGAVVGQAVRTDRLGERILLGLNAISQASRFAEKTEQEVAIELQRLQEELLTLSQVDAEPLPVLEGSAQLDPWLQELGTRLSSLDEGWFDPEDDDDIHEARTQAWISARGRVEAYLAGGHTSAHPGELYTFVARQSPSTLLKFDLGAMSVAEWSDVLYVGLDGDDHADTFVFVREAIEERWWLAAAALQLLGFSFPDRAALLSWVREFGDIEPHHISESSLVGELARKIMPARHAALVVRRSSGSMVEQWKPQPGGAAVAFTAGQLRHLMKQWGKVRFQPSVEPPIQIIVFEMPLDDPKIESHVRQTLKNKFKIEREIPTVYLFAEQPREKTKIPELVPRGLEDLFAYMGSL
jgi:hypothetical protein